eukprot:TRINITY_DN60_c0_g3_i1.p1 TRINITY_DN60_c0_g3~~TRINITY_DN60_c0_g3_i1.p1  ORF type:complete len:239 (+),score=47.68 TRINITY_DN60_c0_g3_i1:307-1023(+)
MDKSKKISWYFFRKRVKNLKRNHNDLKSIHSKLLSDHHYLLRSLYSTSTSNSILSNENDQLKSKISSLQLERESLSKQLFETLDKFYQSKSQIQILQGELNLAISQVSCISKFVQTFKQSIERSQKQHEMDFTQLFNILNMAPVRPSSTFQNSNPFNPLVVESYGVSNQQNALLEKDLADESTDDELYLTPEEEDDNTEEDIMQIYYNKESVCPIKRIKYFPQSVIPKEILRVQKWCN